MDEPTRIISNASFMVKDILEGETKILDRPDFDILTPTEIKRAMDIILGNKYFDDATKKSLLMNSWRLVYKDRPPTPEEFLGPEWIGDLSESIYPYLYEAFIHLNDPSLPYKNLIFFYPIGTGKSFITALQNLYISVIIYMMRNPKKTLGLSSATTICNVFMAHSIDKAKETLAAPFINILDASTKFEQCRTIEQMKRKEKEYGTSKICWSTAGYASAFAIGSNMSIKIKSSIASLLGLTILCGSITEIAFFKDAGFSDEEIMRLYNDMKGRIFSRFPKKNGLNFSILDSSPNDATYASSIDYWIVNEAPKNPENLILKGTKWDLQPWYFEEWAKDRTKVFWMFMGGKDGKLPKVLLTKEETLAYNEKDILECPIDGLQLAKDDPVKFLKDYGGIPSGSSNRLIYDFTKIENIFDTNLVNIYSHITALSIDNPELLIWNRIKDEFFVKLGPEKYEFYRSPLEERFVSVDQSVSGDTACVAVSHPELNLDGEIIDVVDLSLNIIPNKEKINLDAIKFFIHDLRRYGHLNIKHVSFDQFQSESSMQYLERNEFEVERLSVDIHTNPYLNMIQSIYTNRLKMGRNIYMKNNLKSIKMATTKGGKPKVDHEIGKVENSLYANDVWETSSLGFNAKDTSDAVCATIELRKKHYIGTPRYIYQSMNIKESNIVPVEKNLKKLGLKIK